MAIPIFAFLILWVLSTTLIPVHYHVEAHGFNVYQALMSFFLGMNFIVCLWEIGLGLHINLIQKDHKRLQRKFKNDSSQACIDFFCAPMSISDMFSLEFWSTVWSTYSLYDPSYANRESFGFFVDVGNGWTTIIPTVIFQVSMTDGTFFSNYIGDLSAFTVGIIGITSFYQEFYGTAIYFLSFVMNKRYEGRDTFEVALFVGLTNGIWFVFPLLGMFISYNFLATNSFDIVR